MQTQRLVFVPPDVSSPSDSKPVINGRLQNDEGPPDGGPSRALVSVAQTPPAAALTVSVTVPTFQPPWPSETVYWNESLPL